MISTLILNAALAAGPSIAVTPDDVAATALRHETSRHDGAMVLCLQVDRHDPVAAVLAAAQGPGLTVVAGSQCELVMDTKSGSRHRASGRKALFIDVWGYRAGADGFVYVEVTYYHHGLWGGTRTLALRRISGTWFVQAVTPAAVS